MKATIRIEMTLERPAVDKVVYLLRKIADQLQADGGFPLSREIPINLGRERVGTVTTQDPD